MANNPTQQDFSYFEFDNNGIIIPDTYNLKTEVQQEFLNVFGTDLSLEDSTPQGRLIDMETNSRQQTINFTALMANSICNIYNAGGAILDSWLSNFDRERNGATNSTVEVVCGGIPNTIIPANAQAQDVNGNIWLNESQIIIGSNGQGTGFFYAQQTGPLSLGIGELNKIVTGNVTGVSGWETITNNVIATLGSEVESDFSAKQNLFNTIFRGTALFGNYKSAVLQLPNVIDCFTFDNPYDEILYLDNYPINPHSVYVAVLGGEAQAIGQALFYIKSAGAGWNGNTTVIAKDLNYGTSSPVSFYIPAAIPLKINITATSLTSGSANLIENIQNIILNYFSNNYADNNFSAPYIRGIVSPFNLTQILLQNLEGININDIEIGMVNPIPHAVISIFKASITSGIYHSNVDSSTFTTQITNSGTYTFSYNGSAWEYNNNTINLATYGITVLGSPVENDKVIVLYNNGEIGNQPLQVFCTEYPTISAENINVTINNQ